MAAAGCALYRSALAPLPPEAPAGFTSGGYRALYSFGRNGKRGDGNRPAAPLVAVGERLYGTTQYGGVTNAHCKLGCGVVFAVSKSGSESVLYRFKGGSDGAQPLGELANVNGKLIGTTSAGGASGCGAGCGTIFALSTDGSSEATLYRFSRRKRWCGARCRFDRGRRDALRHDAARRHEDAALPAWVRHDF